MDLCELSMVLKLCSPYCVILWLDSGDQEELWTSGPPLTMVPGSTWVLSQDQDLVFPRSRTPMDLGPGSSVVLRRLWRPIN